MTALRSMIDNAFDWARKRNKVIVNPIHGAEEIDIPLDRFWKHVDVHGSKLAFESNFVMEVLWLHNRQYSECRFSLL